MQTILSWKIVATVGGSGLTASAVWLNAEHVASTEGWHSPLVLAGIIVTLCAASAPPCAERAGRSGQPAKALMLWLFFAIAVGFSLSASIARSSGYAAGKAAKAERSNAAARLARDAYDAAKEAQRAECATGRGTRCRAAEEALQDARKMLAGAEPLQPVDPGAERLAAVLGIEPSTVQLYAPLLLPLGLELGGFIFLAFGLAPRPWRNDLAAPLAMPLQEAMLPLQPAATPSPVAAPLVQESVKPAAAGTRAYYLARLEREFPAIAKRVHAGEISVFRASVAAGLRKPPANGGKWTEPASYAAPAKLGA
jgi:hypothetical protein